MKWDEMTARERDELIARKVFGHKTVWNIGEYWYIGEGMNHMLPHYTTDISAAWQVVEKLKETHWCELRIGTIKESALFGSHDTRNESFAQCDIASESICRAALHAIGVYV